MCGEGSGFWRRHRCVFGPPRSPQGGWSPTPSRIEKSMHAFALWVKSTDLSWLVTHYTWVWATSEVLHFIGMSILFGCIGALDLRMLGWWKSPPVAGVNALVRWAVLGF